MNQALPRETRATEAPQLNLPLRVLLIVSRPSDTGFIDPRNSIAPMLGKTDPLARFCQLRPPVFGPITLTTKEIIYTPTCSLCFKAVRAACGRQIRSRRTAG